MTSQRWSSRRRLTPHRALRRRLIQAVALAGLWPAGVTVAQTAPASNPPCSNPVNWPQWQTFLEFFVQPDGRVLDASTPQLHSSSEGQSYGMFFALVANDAATFDRLWRWAVDNLAGGNIQHNLPAWIWGKDDQGKWRVLDDNSASDAELWFVYALLEAGKRWGRTDYTADAMALLKQVEALETSDLAGLGPMLLPGPRHFKLADHVWRLNPSYMPLPVLRRLAQASPKGPWQDIATNTVVLLEACCQKGFAADWVCYQATTDGTPGRFLVDPEKGDIGSYDAIRVYMWAGMTSANDPLAARFLAAVNGMAGVVTTTGAPPEKIHTETGLYQNTGPAGFSAALVPYFHARKEPDLMNGQFNRATTLMQARVVQSREQSRHPPYYDHVLNLFSTGWQRGHYRFTSSGNLQTQWDSLCPPVPVP